ncbi:M56 family metallopeptidase [Pleionea sp. CnH1-48]|uniref:M56 family metallopeptidase n=1 Tax=Pleionea sp. CnH1-48 TaxID=2954494 RepID=UPI0020982023|nr:M56 family metallopeptidase [Pleionea sp. CnH1-48]MCO7223379.1 M56 family metallopeptidase [Pleionea sp. CnH1-48]
MSLMFFWMFFVTALMAWILGNVIAWGVSHTKVCSSVKNERRLLWFAATMPLSLPILISVSLVILSIAKLTGWLDDHCLTHSLHHPHFCLVHFPEVTLSTIQSGLWICVIMVLTSAFIYRAAYKIKALYQRNQLARLVQPNKLFQLFEHRQLLAFTSGVFSPKIFMSTGIMKYLTKREQRIVLAHESAHIRRKDVFKNIWFEIFLTFHLSPGKLQKRWQLSTEIRADQDVANQFNQLEVAEVLLKLARCQQSNLYPVSILGSEVEQRIRFLLEREQSKTKFFSSNIMLWSYFLLLPLLVVSNHHAIETFIGWIL